MRFRFIILSLIVVSILGFSMSQSEVSLLKYQLQMPSIVGSGIGFRMIGTLEEGGFGLVWKLDKKVVLFTGQVLGFNSFFSKWVETGVAEWSKLYFDVFLLLRF